jgi:hypothetical protein
MPVGISSDGTYVINKKDKKQILPRKEGYRAVSGQTKMPR